VISVSAPFTSHNGELHIIGELHKDWLNGVILGYILQFLFREWCPEAFIRKSAKWLRTSRSLLKNRLFHPTRLLFSVPAHRDHAGEPYGPFSEGSLSFLPQCRVADHAAGSF